MNQCCVKAFTRFTRKDISVGEYVIPANSVVSISPMAIHHNSKLWENPEEFIPERFEQATKQESEVNEGPKLLPSSPFAFIPFSQGHRKCIGQQFAMLEAKAILSIVLTNFTVSPPPISLAQHGVEYRNDNWIAQSNPSFTPSDIREAILDWVEAVTIRPANQSGWMLFKRR